MSRRMVGWGGVWVVGTALAFLLLDPILASFIGIVGASLWVVAVLASGWEQHSTFEEREMTRAQRRKEHWERRRDVRDRDRARWEAHQRRRADRSSG